MKKVIVTGGAGFIGSNLIELLIKKKYFVINIDKLSYAANINNLKNLKKKNYIFKKIDLNDRKKIKQILFRYKPQGIFNLAAETHVDRSIDEPKNFINSNILGVYNLLESIKSYISKKKTNFKLIHISTDEVYGDILKGRSKENFPYNPSSPYSASKASSDHLIRSYIRTYNFPAIITNCSNNYGPKQFPEKLIPKLIYNILNNKPLPIYGRGQNSREWIYVEDHCNALIKVFEKGKIGENYNIGSGVNLKNINIVKKLLNVVKLKKVKIGNKVRIKFVKDRPGHDIRYALNSKKIKNQLGWKATTSLENGLLKTFYWYNNNKKYLTKLKKKQVYKRLGLKK
mgnify:CR=1 FL=1